VSTRRHVARCSLHSRIAKYVYFCRKQKNFPQGQPLPPEIFARTDLPLLIAASLDTFCLVAPQKKKFNYIKPELDTGFPTSHQPTFYAAPNFLKMGIKYLNLSSFGQFRQRPLGALYRQYLHLSADHSKLLHNQLPSRYRSHKTSYSHFSPKIGCHSNVSSTCGLPSDT